MEIGQIYRSRHNFNFYLTIVEFSHGERVKVKAFNRHSGWSFPDVYEKQGIIKYYNKVNDSVLHLELLLGIYG